MAKKKASPRKKKRGKKKKQRRHLFLRYAAICILFGITLLALFITSVYYGAFGKIPDYNDLREIRHYEASSLYSSDGELIGKYYIENRTTVPLQQISQSAIDALIATEDVRFFEHKGFDRISMIRVLVKTLLLGDKRAGGGSTLSQQLAKNLFPRESGSRWKMPVIKVKEIITAHRLEKLYSKPEILTLYLNTVSFGEDVFGIESAAQKYFSTTATRLSIPESATLIGMLKGPGIYNPRLYPDRALGRRNTVIAQMVKYDYLDDAVGEKLKATPLGLKYQPVNHYSGLAPYLREKIRQDAHGILKEYNEKHGKNYDLYKDGLKIKTTLDARMQRYAEKAVIEHMTALQKTFDQHWAQQSPWDKEQEILNQAIKQSQRYKSLKKQGVSEQQIRTEFGKKESMTLYSPGKGEETRELSPLDSIKHYLKILHPGVIAADPRTGQIKVWVGGLNFKYFQYDQVSAARQVGSVFKPVIYSEALTQETSPDLYYENTQRSYPKYDNWSPRNSDGQYGGFYTLKGALSSSVNTIAVEVLLGNGIHETIGHATELGITSPLPAVPALALGAASIPLEEMIIPYMCFANNGQRVSPYYIEEIRDANGHLLYQAAKSNPQRVIPATQAHLMSAMLSDVINSGTGSRLRSRYGIECALAGKTGTTQNNADGWFIGYNPEIVIGVRVGANDSRVHFRTTSLGQGANTALPIFGLLMKSCLASPAYSHWKGLKFPWPVLENPQALAAAPFLEEIPTVGWPPHLQVKVHQQKTEKENSRASRREARREARQAKRENEKRGILRRIFGGKD